jgi:hypothetical protein
MSPTPYRSAEELLGGIAKDISPHPVPEQQTMPAPAPEYVARPASPDPVLPGIEHAERSVLPARLITPKLGWFKKEQAIFEEAYASRTAAEESRAAAEESVSLVENLSDSLQVALNKIYTRIKKLDESESVQDTIQKQSVKLEEYQRLLDEAYADRDIIFKASEEMRERMNTYEWFIRDLKALDNFEILSAALNQTLNHEDGESRKYLSTALAQVDALRSQLKLGLSAPKTEEDFDLEDIKQQSASVREQDFDLEDIIEQHPANQNIQ